jgi:hypothetical protein
MNDPFDLVTEEVELLLAESAQLASSGPHFLILHRFHRPGAGCAPGEEAAGIWLVFRGRLFPLKLSLALRLFFNYLAVYRWLGQSASQIEAGMKVDRFSLLHGFNARSGRKQTRRTGRSAVRVYVERTREALRLAFQEAGVNLDPSEVMRSESTVANEVQYRLRGTMEWIHTQ